jgi:hypothetical protein
MSPSISRYDRSAVPDSTWPDGSPVSNWSKAVAALALASGPAQSTLHRLHSHGDILQGSLTHNLPHVL